MSFNSLCIVAFSKYVQGEASWTRPETAASSHASEEAPLAITNGIDNDAAGGANEWVSYIDENTEQAYWYNIRTGETSWA